MASITVNRAELESLYPGVDLEGFAPSHRAFVFQSGRKKPARVDYVCLSKADAAGVRFGYVPGNDEPSYGVLETGLWQSLESHGLVKAETVKYVPDYVPVLERDGLVYLIQRGPDGPVKIGWSQNIPGRKSNMQVANAEKLHVIGAIPGRRKDEQEAHRRFSHLRMEGEWFRNSEEILSFFRARGGARPIRESDK